MMYFFLKFLLQLNLYYVKNIKSSSLAHWRAWARKNKLSLKSQFMQEKNCDRVKLAFGLATSMWNSPGVFFSKSSSWFYSYQRILLGNDSSQVHLGTQLLKAM